MFKLDFKEIDELERDLKTFAARAYPFAVKTTINSAAFDARRHAQARIGRDFVERNKWTRGSVRVEQERGLRVKDMEAAVGSIEKYMETQEFGGVKRGRGRRGLPVPTGYAAGQEGRRPRTRLVRLSNKLARLKLAKFRARAKTHKQRVAIAINRAVKNKKRSIFLESGNGKKQGMFRVLGGRIKGGRVRGAKLKMLYDLSKKSVRIPKDPWLGPSVLLATMQMDDHYRKALLYQLDRHKVFRK